MTMEATESALKEMKGWEEMGSPIEGMRGFSDREYAKAIEWLTVQFGRARSKRSQIHDSDYLIRKANRDRW